jgi:hypothetical protein
MPFQMALWEVKGNSIQPINRSQLNLEDRLEQWILQDPSLLGLRIGIIGNQIRTLFGGFIDLLGIDKKGDLVVIELKKDKTPRDIVAQSLDYASWINDLGFEELNEICKTYREKELEDIYQEAFGESLPDGINLDHKIVIVAGHLDDSTARIVEYLSEKHGLNINVLFFNIFKSGETELVGRSWLSDPETTEVKSQKGSKRTWTGYYFVNSGILEGDTSRVWDNNLKYGYVSAGGGTQWSKPLEKLKIGDQVFAYVKGQGYVGYGSVEEASVPVKDFKANGKPILDHLGPDHKWNKNAQDLSKSEYLVRVKWIKTFSISNAKYFKGIFANQNIVCQLKDQETAKFLLKEFEVTEE